MSKKTKVITSNIQPNPKEAEIWAKINKDGSREVKQYNNSTGKFECCGGSGSGSSDGIEYTYFDLRNYNLGENDSIYLLNLLLCSSLLYLPQTDNNPPGVFTYGMLSFYSADALNALGVAIDESMTITIPGSETLTTVKELLISGITEEKYNAIPRITKEEFYNLEA